jgi:hypothetical protein
MEQLGTHCCKQMVAHSYKGQEVVARGLQGNLHSRSSLVRSKEHKSNKAAQSLRNIHHRLKPSNKMPLSMHRDIVNFLCLCTMSPYHQEEWAAVPSYGKGHTEYIDLQLLFQS